MHPEDDVYWFGSYLHVPVMIAFLVNIWLSKNCSGISLRSQFLYALVFTTRHQDLDTPYLPVENIILKVAYLIVTWGTVLTMLMYFRNTYEKRNDRARIDIWIAACVVMGLCTNARFGFLGMLTAFSFFLEAVAMIPQFQFIGKTERIDKNVILYLAAMGVYTVLEVAYSVQQFSRRPEIYSFRMAAPAVRLLLYCDFFYRIYPWLTSRDDDQEHVTANCGCFGKMYSFLCASKPDDVEADVESELPKKGHLTENMSNIVLVHSGLTGIQNEKEPSDK